MDRFAPDSVLIVRNPEEEHMLVPDTLVARARRELSIPVFEVRGDPSPPPPPVAADAEARSGEQPHSLAP